MKLPEHLQNHKTNELNEKLKIRVMDEPGPSGAHHHYCIYLPNDAFNEELNAAFSTHLCFQNGPVPEGINGITQESLLAVIEHRLVGFQSGKFACEANDQALHHVRAAMEVLKARTKERIERGVEGTLQK